MLHDIIIVSFIKLVIQRHPSNPNCVGSTNLINSLMHFNVYFIDLFLLLKNLVKLHKNFQGPTNLNNIKTNKQIQNDEVHHCDLTPHI